MTAAAGMISSLGPWQVLLGLLLVCAMIVACAALFFEVLPRLWRPLEAGSELYNLIGHFYDASSPIWESVWGEHMHSGFYPLGVDTSKWTQKMHVEAQHRMMEELVSLWTPPVPNKTVRVLDMGCGVGGSSRFLYRHLKELQKTPEIVGITLSSYQCQRATQYTTACKEIECGTVTFQVANAMHTAFPDHSFDLIWSLESGEHMPDKHAWLQEVHRLLRPGGVFLCATWCHREEDKQQLSSSEIRLLGRICKNYALPAFVPVSIYGKFAETLNFTGFDKSAQSWTANVLPFWPAVLRSALRPSSLFRLVLALPFGGWTTIKGAITAFLMLHGFSMGTLNFGVFAIRTRS